MDIRTVNREELMRMITQGVDFTLIDVLPAEHFEREHIKGAISLPLEGLKSGIEKLIPDKDDTIVVYCASFTCRSSTAAARTLQSLGYKDVYDYKGGLEDYKKGGGAVEGTLCTAIHR